MEDVFDISFPMVFGHLILKDILQDSSYTNLRKPRIGCFLIFSRHNAHKNHPRMNSKPTSFSWPIPSTR